MNLSESSLSKYFDLFLSAEPVWLTNKLVFLGEIPRKFSFEGKSFGTDKLTDDSALAYDAKTGLTIITGCSHSGICSIVEHAKQVCNSKKVSKIIGGLHLLNPSNKQLHGTINYLKKLNLSHLYACHCTDLKSKIVLSRKINIEETSVGFKL